VTAGPVVMRAEDVRVDYDDRRVLHDVSLPVRLGEVLALIGPNGAGKSTLLGALTGDVPLSGGRVLVDDRPLPSWKLKDLARRRAVLMQQSTVSFPFTAVDVIRMGRAPWRGTDLEAEDDDAVADAIDLADLVPLAERRVPTLSGGERARVGLARVLAQRTSILLLDEPTAALDLRHQEAVLSLARDAATEGAAVVIVLHDLNLASAFADRVAIVSDGRLVADGTPDAVLTADRLSSVYECDVEVFPHPVDGSRVILPVRR
jgi:iron complex transport system ATP-binding protein